MVEATAGTIHETAKDPAAGIAAILSPALAARVRGPAQKLASGRVLHFALGDGTNATTDERLTHIVVVYGVSGERSETGARATLAKLVAAELDKILSNTNYAKDRFLLYMDANTAPESGDRASGRQNTGDTASHALWRVALKHKLVDVMGTAYKGRPPMTYFGKGKLPTSRIDMIYASPNMGPYAAATATAPAGLSATHAAMAVSFTDKSHTAPTQDHTSPEAIDHAVAYMTECGGRKWTLSEKATERYTLLYSTDPETRLRVQNAVRAWESDLTSTSTMHDHKARGIALGAAHVRFYDAMARAMLFAEKTARGSGPTQTNRKPANNTHAKNQISTTNYPNTQSKRETSSPSTYKPSLPTQQNPPTRQKTQQQPPGHSPSAHRARTPTPPLRAPSHTQTPANGRHGPST